MNFLSNLGHKIWIVDKCNVDPNVPKPRTAMKDIKLVTSAYIHLITSCTFLLYIIESLSFIFFVISLDTIILH